MKKEAFYALLGDMDEHFVQAAETAPQKKSGRRWLRFGLPAAACAALIAGIGFRYQHATPPLPDSAVLSPADSSEADIAIEEDDVSIYYVDGDEIQSVSEFLPCTAKDIFAAWKTHNGIGDEVQLIDVRIENNGTESADAYAANYTAGDQFIMNVKITENLKAYYAEKSEEKLLESLKLTLTGYSHIEFDAYNLIFESGISEPSD